MPGAFAIFVISLSLGQAARTLPEIGREVGTEPAVVLLKSGKGFKGHIQVAPNGQSLRHLRLGKDPEYACAEIQSVAMERKGRRVKRNLARWGLGFGVLMAGSAVAMAGGGRSCSVVSCEGATKPTGSTQSVPIWLSQNRGAFHGHTPGTAGQRLHFSIYQILGCPS